jgi:hypothetical protein
MIDLLIIALTIAFFVVAGLFVGGCGRIVNRGSHENAGDSR